MDRRYCEVLSPLTPIHHALLPPQLPPLLFHRQHHLLLFPVAVAVAVAVAPRSFRIASINELASTLGYYLSANYAPFSTITLFLISTSQASSLTNNSQ
jgi:hypothetical protein